MTMRAAILEAIGRPLVVEEVALRAPGAHEVVVRIAAIDVCITDALSARGDVAAAPPTILGHAAAGVVEEVGAHVERVRVGDRVVVAGTPECGECFWCIRDQPDQCAQMLGGILPPRVVGTRADGQPVHADGGVGAFAERMVLRDSGVVAVDADLPDEHLSLLGCGVTAGVGAVLNLAQVQAGSSVAVVGCGALGLWMIQGARVAGATTIVAVEPRAERRELALAVGATHALDPADGDPVAAVKALTGGRGADYALEAAGPPEAMAQALAMTRPAGTMVPAGWETLSSTVTLPAVDFAVGGKRIQSCQYGGAHIRRDIPRFAGMLEAGLLHAEPLVSRRFALDAGQRGAGGRPGARADHRGHRPRTSVLTYDCPTMSTAPTDAATTTSPEPELTPDELIARAIAMRPELIEHQADAEARTFYSEEMHQKFLDAGFYRTYMPRRYGGLEFDVRTMTRLQLELARGDMSTAWCVGLASNHALQVGSWFGEEAQAEAFAGGNFRAASVAAPTVTATPVDGGWEINGTIGYCSGIPYSNWYMGQAIMPGQTPTGEPRMMLFIAPESEWEMLNDWGDQLGLRGSGSQSIRFEGGRIASHLALEDTSMIDVDPSNGTPGLALHGNPLYCGRALCVFTMSVAGLVIGGAYNALDEYENWMRNKLTPLPPMIKRTEDPDFQRWYGLAAAQIGTAEAALMNCADRHMEYCRLQAAGERAYTWEDDLYLSTIAREAIIQAWQAVENNLYRTIGSSAAKNGQRFERVYRDLAMAAGHRNTMMRDPLVRQLAQLRLGVVPAGMQR